MKRFRFLFHDGYIIIEAEDEKAAHAYFDASIMNGELFENLVVEESK